MATRYVSLRSPVFLLMVCSGCHEAPEVYTSVESVKSPLVAGFASYMTPDEVSHRLSPDLLPWEIVEDSQLPAGDKRPPFNILIVSVGHFEHLAHVGELKLDFFNRRLESTWFFPQNGPAFLATLRAHGIDLIGSHEMFVAPYTRVWTAKDYRGRMYVAWEDTRLREQSNRWISRYS